MRSRSGTERNTFSAARPKWLFWSADAFAALLMMPNMNPWSSTGASSLGENIYIGNSHQAERGPDGIDRGTRAHRAIEHSTVSLAQAVEVVIDPARESALFPLGAAEQLRAHHRRQRQRHDAGNRDRAREREGEFAKQRAREAALQTDGRVNGGERDRHGDHRPDQLARADQERPGTACGLRAGGVRRFQPRRWRRPRPDRPTARWRAA